MQETKVITANSIESVWQQMDTDFSYSPELFEYDAIIYHNQKAINLTIDIDLCGGFEGGYAFTNFISELECDDTFRLCIHHQHFMDRNGEFYDLNEVVSGYQDFDNKLVCKTNDIDRFRELIADESTREVLKMLPNFHFFISRHTSDYTQLECSFLELKINGEIVEPNELRKVYDAYARIVDIIEDQGSSVLRFL